MIPVDFNRDSCAERVLRRIAQNAGAEDAALLAVDTLAFRPAEDNAMRVRTIDAHAYRNAYVVKSLSSLEDADALENAQKRHCGIIAYLQYLLPPMFTEDFLIAGVPPCSGWGGAPFTAQQQLPLAAWGLAEEDIALQSSMRYAYGESQLALFTLFFFGRRGIVCK